MFDFIEKLRLAKMIRFEKGKLSFMGVQINIVPSDMLVGIQNRMIKKFGLKDTYEILYNQVKESSKIGCDIFLKRYNIRGFDETLDWLTKVFMSTGYGKIVKINANKYTNQMFIAVDDSVFISKKRKNPTCFILAGLFAGGASILFNRNLDFIETKCVSKGNDQCEFEGYTNVKKFLK